MSRRVLAALLAVVLVFGTGVAGLTAMAAQTVNVVIANIPRGNDSQYSNKNWGHPELKLMNGWVVHVETYFTVKILDNYDTGNAVYCIEPASSLHTGDSLTSQDNTVNFFRSRLPWNGTLSGEWQRKLIAAILYHGYHGTCNLNTWMTQNAGGRAQLAKYWATQLLVWESIVGERDPNFNRINVPSGYVSVDGFVTNGNPIRSDIYAQMADIEKKVKEELLCPSFVNQNGGLAETFTLKYDTASKQYKTTVTDKNGVLSKWNFSGTGLTFTKSGNDLTISASQPINGTVEFQANKNVPTSSMVVWSDGNFNKNGDGKQDLVAYGSNTSEDFTAYAKVKTEAPQVGKLTLTKVDKDYPENKLTGGEFTVYDNPQKLKTLDESKCKKLGTMKETEKGVYEMGDLPLGAYLVVETKTPDGFLRDTTAHYVEIIKAGETVVVSNDAESRAFINQRSTTQSTTKSTTQSTTNSTTQSTTKSTTQSTTKSTTKPTTESTTQSTTESTTQSTTEPTTESTTEPTTRIVPAPTTKPTTPTTTTATTTTTTTTTRPAPQPTTTTRTTTKTTARRAAPVNTGDESRPLFWSLIAALTAVAVGIVFFLRREETD